MTTEEMCIEARKVVLQQVNRSAGQHIRAMRNATYTSALDTLYHVGCQYDISNTDMQALCAHMNVNYDDLQNHNTSNSTKATPCLSQQ